MGEIGKTIAWHQAGNTPAPSGLPDDLVRSASRRLALLAVVVSGMVFLFFLLDVALPFLGGPDSDADSSLALDLFCYAAVFAISAVVWMLARSPRLAPIRKLDVGLFYEVAIAAVGVAFRIADPGNLRIVHDGVPEICVIILLFPVLVPNTPRKVFVAAFVAATLDPAGVLIAGRLGGVAAVESMIGWEYVWSYLCVGLAVLSSRVLYGLGREVSRAREMGAYRLAEPLGQGGMGEVWKARHHLLARDAAIKVIQPERLLVGDEEASSLLRRFEREAQATAALESPHTVELYDFGVTDEGTFFYVMELLDGLDLDTLVRRHGPVPSDRVVRILIQACHSLADAHARGLIHRDVKPANVFLCRKGLDTDFVKVLDFGLVKSRTAAPDDAGHTLENAVLGTPAYMPPEMIRSGTQLDGRADLYSLGCVAYWLLTGRLVFDATSPADVMIRHVNDEPEPPSAHSELEVDRDLERIVLQCLQKDRDDRPASAEELMTRLRQLPIARDWTAERSREWWERHAPIPRAQVHAEAVPA